MRPTAALLLAAALLTGCSAGEQGGESDPTASTASTEPTGSSPGSSTPAVPEGSRLRVEKVDLDWREVARVPLTDEAPISTPIGAGYTTALDAAQTTVTVTATRGAEPVLAHRASAGYLVTDLQVDAGRLLVVEETADEDRPKPPLGTLYDLAGDTSSSLRDAHADDDDQAPAPAPALGSWSLRGDTLVYPYQPRASAYCLAAAALTDEGLAGAAVEQVHCVTGRNGLRGQQVTPGGIGWVDFDDSRPSCLTPWLRPDGEPARRVEGPQACATWQVVPLDSGGPLVWSSAVDEDQVDRSILYASAGLGGTTEPAELGAATTGSLTWCGGAVYWTTPPGSVHRWAGGERVEEVFTADRETYLGSTSVPVCGGDTVSFTTTEGTTRTPGDELRAVTLAAGID